MVQRANVAGEEACKVSNEMDFSSMRDTREPSNPFTPILLYGYCVALIVYIVDRSFLFGFSYYVLAI